ncbi:MAG TPA: HepT-like ribonuclease domain-containing protein [Thermoanaerobaculia bacterium]|nr:HepT-like ribonuclease domain-containing protein [Thermoanaerobaculia bacterium]
MLDAAEAAADFARGRTRRDLEADRMLLFALTRAIEIVGEAASKVGEGTRAQLSRIPWPMIVAMRHRIVHAYFDINLDILWRTVAEELPALVHELRRGLESE